MATTLQIIDAVVERLKVKLPQLAVEYFPDRPAEYRLNHPRGALLVSYLGSQFDTTVDVTYIAQPRTVKLSVTVILRQLMASMRQAKLGDDIFGSSATDNFREMADSKTADSIAAMRQFGIADMVEAQFRARAAGGVQ